TNNNIDSSPVLGDVDGDNRLDVIIGCWDHNLYALNGEDGSLLWIYSTDNSIVSSPALGDINNDSSIEVIFGSFDGNIYALSLGTKSNCSRVYWSCFGGDSTHSRNVFFLDSDGDMLSTHSEIILGTNPYNNDTDSDGMPDGWEIFYGFNATNASDANNDADGDGLTNFQEYTRGTNPLTADSDNDYIPDNIDIFPNDSFLPVSIILIPLLILLGTTLIIKRKSITKAKVKIKVEKAINLAKQNLFGIKSISKFVTSQTLDGIIIASKVITFINCFLPFLLGFPGLAFTFLLIINIAIIATLKKSSTWFLIAFPVWLLISMFATMAFFYVYNPAPLLSYEWFVRMEFFGEKPYAVIFFFLMFMGPSPTVLFYALTLHLLETFKVFNYEILIGGFLVRAYVVISTLSATILTLFWLSIIIYSIRNTIASGTVSVDILEKWKKYVVRLTIIKVESRRIKILVLSLLFIFSITSTALYVAYSSSHAPPYPKVLWTYTTENSVHSSPALSDLNGDGKIDVVVGSLDYNVYAMDGETGDLLWSFKTNNQISSSPAIGDLNNDGKLEVVIGSKDRNVYALNGKNGTLLWKYSVGNSIPLSPVLGDVDGDGKLEIIIGCSNGLIYVLNGEDGTLLWKRGIGDGIVVSPALGDINNDSILEIVIPNDDGYIYALSGENGSQLWFYPVFTAIRSSPAIGDIDGDNLMEVVIGCGDWEIYALNGEDGSVLWKFHVRSPLRSSPALGDINSDGKLEVVIGDLSYRVYAINGSNGSLLWKEYVEGRVRSSPAIGDVDNDNKLDVIIHTDLGYLYALDGEDGHVLWRYETHGGYSSPALGDIDRDGKIEIVLGSFDKKIYALNFPDEKNSGFRVYWSSFGGNLFNNRNAKSLDPDEDCLSNYSESVIKTKPDNNDTDGDGMPDEW
ncbi:MAG: hypothetical protein DRP61_06015, partial [Candidatus Omnitrophota bacterium]